MGILKKIEIKEEEVGSIYRLQDEVIDSAE